MARPAPPSDDGSPARPIAMMVGIVAILLLASLAWSAVGALISAVGSAGTALTSARTAPATLAPPVDATATEVIAVVVPTSTPASPTPAPAVTAVAASTPTPVALTPTAQVAVRNPWILLPQPEPGSRVTPGSVTVEARGRGDVPIATIRLELDGSALPVSIEQRSESTWRGFATIRVPPGEHAVRAVVTDTDGRSGSFRWSFSAGS